MIGTERRRLRPKQAAAYLEVSASTLAKWRMGNLGPPFHRCGPRLVFYFVDEVDRWLEECASPAADQAGQASDRRAS